MRRRRLNILVALLVLAFCRLLRDSSVAPATAASIAPAEQYPTTAPAKVATDKDRDPSWDWLFVRSAPTIDAPSDGTGQSTELAGFVMPTIHVFSSPDSPGLWNRAHQTDESLRLVGGLFDDHFKTPEIPWIDPPVSPTPHGDDPPSTPVAPPAPALAIASDPPSFGQPPPQLVIPPPPPVGGSDSLPPVPGPVSTPTPEPNSILLPLIVLLLARRFPARG
jgi:hypothetical protein